MPVYFLEPGAVQGRQVTVTGPLAHHLIASLRVQPGEELWLAEAGTRRYRTRITTTDRKRLTAEVLSEFDRPASAGPIIDLGLALIKSEHMDWAVQKATELGVSRIVPLVTARSVIRPRAERISQRTGRWQSIAREAAQQSMRWDIPEVREPQALADWCKEQQTDCRLLLWEKGEGKSLREKLDGIRKPESIALGLGPEGGLQEEEVRQARINGFEPVSLGGRILRTETAVIAAVAIIQYKWGDLG
jgi:16S rRNA (uracil1498-N3)-methyltransferase